MGAGIRFTDNWDVSAERLSTYFVRVTVCSEINDPVVCTAPLKNRAAFSGSSINVDALALTFKFFQQLIEFLPMDIDPVLKVAVRLIRVDL